MSHHSVICSVCGKRVTIICSAEWNSETCFRCLPENPNPELARLLRMKAADERTRHVLRPDGT